MLEGSKSLMKVIDIPVWKEQLGWKLITVEVCTCLRVTRTLSDRLSKWHAEFRLLHWSHGWEPVHLIF